MFFDTLIDENAATPSDLGNGYDHPVEDAKDKKRINESRVHIDFMIGSREPAVDGITRPQSFPVLREGVWQISARANDARADATSSRLLAEHAGVLGGGRRAAAARRRPPGRRRARRAESWR